MSDDTPHRKRIGFLSFGHWSTAPGSQTTTGGDSLRQTVELAVAAEELGIDGAFVRVHHFQRQLASPFPLLAAIGTATRRIEIGTGVIDMRYENPLYMAEDAASADLLAGGRLQLGISRGSPEPALHGSRAFGHIPPRGKRTPTSPAATPSSSAPRSPASPSSRPTRGWRAGSATSRSSRAPRACRTASGGVPGPVRPASGPPARA